jgi:hypothetical protein
MSRAHLIMVSIAIGLVVVLIMATSGPVTAKPKGTVSQSKCGSDYTACLQRCKGPFAPGRNEEQCNTQCGFAVIDCLDAINKKSGIDPGTTGGTPPRKWQPPVNVGVIPPMGGTGTSPPKPPIGVHPVTPINPVSVDQPGTGTGSGVTILKQSGTVKTPVVAASSQKHKKEQMDQFYHKKQYNIKEQSWGSSSQSSSFSMPSHGHGRHK